MTRVLAFDVGKSRCRAVVFVDGVRVATAEGPGTGGLAEARGAEDALAAMRPVAADLHASGHLDVVAAGVAGFARAGERGRHLAPLLVRHFDVAQVVVASDMTTSHIGALGGRPGVVVAGGTGSVALAVAADGTRAAADGWGYLLGDTGSGFSLGRRGLDAALRAHDGRGGSEALRARARERYGDLDRLPDLVHGSAHPVRTVAAFAEDVVAAAEAGDERSAVLVTETAHELARTAAAAALRALPEGAPVELSVTGGLFSAGALLVEPFAAELARLLPASRRLAPEGDAADGCHLLATRVDLPHEPSVQRLQGDPRA